MCSDLVFLCFIQGLGPSCQYFLEPAVSIEVHKQVETLDKRHGSAHIKPSDVKLIRSSRGITLKAFLLHCVE